jgi:rubrerythrin
MKKYWRCTICNDIHYGNAPPELCPTCMQNNAYVETTAEEAKKVMHL